MKISYDTRNEIATKLRETTGANDDSQVVDMILGTFPKDVQSAEAEQTDVFEYLADLVAPLKARADVYDWANIEVECMNCHSLTKTYGQFWNQGNGNVVHSNREYLPKYCAHCGSMLSYNHIPNAD